MGSEFSARTRSLVGSRRIFFNALFFLLAGLAGSTRIVDFTSRFSPRSKSCEYFELSSSGGGVATPAAFDRMGLV